MQPKRFKCLVEPASSLCVESSSSSPHSAAMADKERSVSPCRGKKPRSKPKLWQVNVRKLKRNSGMPYRSPKNQLVPSPNPPTEVCSLSHRLFVIILSVCTMFTDYCGNAIPGNDDFSIYILTLSTVIVVIFTVYVICYRFLASVSSPAGA